MQRSPPSLSHLAAPTPPSSFSPHHPSQQRSPLPLPQQRQPQPPPTAAGATSVRTQSGLNVVDPISEARRSLALLVGTTQTDLQTKGGGLLDTLESQVERVLNAYERAYQEDDQSNLNSELEKMFETLENVIMVLSRSSLGGYPVEGRGEAGQIEQGEMERAHKMVQGLFKEVQRTKEAGEIVRAGLAG